MNAAKVSGEPSSFDLPDWVSDFFFVSSAGRQLSWVWLAEWNLDIDDHY